MHQFCLLRHYLPLWVLFNLYLIRKFRESGLSCSKVIVHGVHRTKNKELVYFRIRCFEWRQALRVANLKGAILILLRNMAESNSKCLRDCAHQTI
jgi:hypothetical protein